MDLDKKIEETSKEALRSAGMAVVATFVTLLGWTKLLDFMSKTFNLIGKLDVYQEMKTE